MNTKSQPATASRGSSLKFGAARLHARITRRLVRAYGHSFTQFDTDHNLFGSLWSPVRLDLLKAPLTRHRE